jgi:hypothetical protein
MAKYLQISELNVGNALGPGAARKRMKMMGEGGQMGRDSKRLCS